MVTVILVVSGHSNTSCLLVTGLILLNRSTDSESLKLEDCLVLDLAVDVVLSP
jgi:hypothetical protein